jgi:hypothetical protein
MVDPTVIPTSNHPTQFVHGDMLSPEIFLADISEANSDDFI